MKKRPELAWIVTALLLACLLIIGYLTSEHYRPHSYFRFSFGTVDTVLIGFLAAKIILFISAILFTIQGFRVHWGWGLANLLLFPVAGIALFIKHRHAGNLPMAIWTAGMVLIIVLLVSVNC